MPNVTARRSLRRRSNPERSPHPLCHSERVRESRNPEHKLASLRERSRTQRAESREQRAESREQRAESRKQKAESRKRDAKSKERTKCQTSRREGVFDDVAVPEPCLKNFKLSTEIASYFSEEILAIIGERVLLKNVFGSSLLPLYSCVPVGHGKI